MKCKCGAVSTVLVENEDGTVTPKCHQCYYNPEFEDNKQKHYQLKDSPDKECTHPKRHIVLVWTCGACGERLNEL